MSRGMTKDFCRGGKRVGAPGFLIGSSNKSQSGRRKWRIWTTQNEEAGPATIWLILVNNSPFLEEGISSNPLKFDCPALRYLHLQGHAVGGKAMNNCPLPNTCNKAQERRVYCTLLVSLQSTVTNESAPQIAA